MIEINHNRIYERVIIGEIRKQESNRREASGSRTHFAKAHRGRKIYLMKHIDS